MRAFVPDLTISLSILLAAGAAPAIEGVLEINQTCAEQTGCFAGDDAGFPVTLSAAGASYRLTGPLVLPAGTNGISIDADGISLDLGGFEIRGPVSCTGGPPPVCTPNSGTGTGISGTGVGASVRNGTVRGMAGVGVGLGVRAEVTELRIHFNRGFALIVGDSSRVSKNLVVQNGVLQSVSGTAIIIGEASTVSNNVIHRNGGHGIFSNGSAGNTVVTGNVSSSNGVSGIQVGPRSLVAHNTASGNLGGHGVSAGDGSTITGNTASDNDLSGISTGTGSLVIGNTATGNDDYGLSLGAQSGYRENVLSGNVLGALNGTSIVNLGNNACNAVLCP